MIMKNCLILVFSLIVVMCFSTLNAQNIVHRSVSKSLIGCEGAEIEETSQGFIAKFPEVKHYNGYIDVGFAQMESNFLF